jgi:hypothetical protein
MVPLGFIVITQPATCISSGVVIRLPRRERTIELWPFPAAWRVAWRVITTSKQASSLCGEDPHTVGEALNNRVIPGVNTKKAGERLLPEVMAAIGMYLAAGRRP